MVGKYRKEATDGFTFNDLVNYGYDNGKEDLIPVSMVNDVLDAIESDVRDIIHLLSGIKGLSEIDEVKNKLETLEESLY